MRRRRKQLRRSRSIVLIGIAGFVLSQLALAVAAETLFPELRDPAYGIRSRLCAHRLSDAGRLPDVVCFGSSRIETGIRPEMLAIPNSNHWCFNFGLTGGSPIHQWLAFRRVIETGARPRIALIEIMPALLVDSRPIEQCVYPDRLGWRDVVDLLPDSQDVQPLVIGWLTAKAGPIYNSRFLITSRVMPNWLPIANRTDYLWADMDRWGGQRLPATVETPEQRLKGWQQARLEYAGRLRDFEVSPTHAEYVRRLLTECRRRDVTPVLLLMPESQAFQAMYSNLALEKLSTFLAELPATIIDARNWLDEAAFYDGHHLLPAGAAVLSKRLRSELAQIADPY